MTEGEIAEWSKDDEAYSDQYVLDELERLSAGTSDELQSRIQAIYMWLREQEDEKIDTSDIPEAGEEFFKKANLRMPNVPNLERMAKAICSAWPKVPDGCAAICMDRLGNIPQDGCRHAVEVHGERAKLILTKGQTK